MRSRLLLMSIFALLAAGLLAQTNDDEALTLAWDHANGQWLQLGSEHRNPVGQAIRMARSQIAPDLLLLPTSPPER